ncbi:MAG: DUF4129 domain-containing protein [Bacillota bacterium]
MKYYFMAAGSIALEEDREHLREILSRDEFTAYHVNKEDFPGRLLERLWEKIMELLSLVPVPGGHAKDFLVPAVAAVLVALLLYAGYRMVMSLLGRRRLLRDHGGKVESSPGRYTDLLLRARELGATGEWREGIRYAYLALLFYMESKNWIRVEKWKTNFEYMLELNESNRELSEAFRSRAGIFERVWYGKGAVDESLFMRYVSWIEEDIEGGGRLERT